MPPDMVKGALQKGPCGRSGRTEVRKIRWAAEDRSDPDAPEHGQGSRDGGKLRACASKGLDFCFGQAARHLSGGLEADPSSLSGGLAPPFRHSFSELGHPKRLVRRPNAAWTGVSVSVVLLGDRFGGGGLSAGLSALAPWLRGLPLEPCPGSTT